MRRIVRILAFGVAASLALRLAPWPPAAGAYLSLSPLLGMLGALAVRAVTAWTLVSVAVLVLVWLRPRWFCRYLCPVGLITESAGRLNPCARGRFARFPMIGRWLLWLMIGGAILGYPVFIWLDPLSLFNGFVSAWRSPVSPISLALAMGIPAAVVISLLWPQAWCHRICPLGAAQDLLIKARQGWKRSRPPPSSDRSISSFRLDFTRRGFLGVVGGGMAALALRRTARGRPLPIRPPGACDAERFAGLCARCGACIRACPPGILKPDLGQSGWTGWLSPVVDYSDSYCFEFCNACTQVCPTGAIRRLALETKRNRSIGLATVDRNRCIAWSRGRHCMACQEFCPYLAIDAVSRDGVKCPQVNADMCRGCGACQVACPIQPVKAITVAGQPQGTVMDLEQFLLDQTGN